MLGWWMKIQLVVNDWLMDGGCKDGMMVEDMNEWVSGYLMDERKERWMKM